MEKRYSQVCLSGCLFALIAGCATRSTNPVTAGLAALPATEQEKRPSSATPEGVQADRATPSEPPELYFEQFDGSATLEMIRASLSNLRLPPVTKCVLWNPSAERGYSRRFFLLKKTGTQAALTFILMPAEEVEGIRGTFKRRGHTLPGEAGVLGWQIICQVTPPDTKPEIVPGQSI